MENENQVTPTVTEQSTGQQNQEPATNPTNGEKSAMQPADRTFTRDEVTRILKRRIDRYQNSVYNKYGVKDATELDSLFEKAKGYDDLIKSKDELSEKVAFLSNNINPERYDDIRTYFKGKGIPFTEDALKQHMASHPEWVKQSVTKKPTTTITPVGTEQSGHKNPGEKEIAERMFGMTL